MLILGLHILDAGILVGFLILTLGVGVWASRTVQKESDFFLGGRRLGRVLQFFLNFGNATDTTGAISVSREVFRQGAGGIWIGLQTLFITPFFWFTQPWFRRARLTTMSDLFVDRFGSQGLAAAYAAFNIFIALFTMGMGNVATYKAASAMMIKPAEKYSIQEARQVAEYREYRDLQNKADRGVLPTPQKHRFEYLSDLNKRGDLRAFISWVQPLPFYVIYSSIIAIYIILGGLKAAAVSDAIQGLLIVTMSVLMIPMGLKQVGGFHGLHEIVPAYKFALFGSEAMSEYTWYSIFAITFASLVQIIGLLHNMSAAGSATNEDTARFGMIAGGFTKRVILIAWMLCGLLAIGVLRGGLADPDNAWGSLSEALLGPGLIGFMLAGIVLGHMPSVGLSAVAVSALATKNLYEPAVKAKSAKHYLRVGQIAVAGVLVMAVVFALLFSNVLEMVTMMITFNTFFGAAVFLIFFWRRLTAKAIWIGLMVWVVLIGIVPWALPHVPALARQPMLLAQTTRRAIEVLGGANAADVAAGVAKKIGEPIRKEHVQLPASVYFDSVAHVDPKDANSPMEGLGRFNVEVFLIGLLGVPVTHFTPAGLVATHWLFDGLFPFMELMVLSWLTSLRTAADVDGFYAKMKTPVAPTPEQDRERVAESYAEPRQFEHLKLFPGSNWEFTRWCKKDYAGFFGCWVIVGAILLLLWGVVSVGG
ncbi:MAG TPA: hypothetical protein VGG19_00950 [Tepidisphaeraceae bacterium]